MKIIKSERHQELLSNTIRLIRESSIVPYIKDVILYGSCARQEEKWKSDVDLFIELEPEILNQEDIYEEFKNLCTQVRPSKISSPDVDIHFSYSDKWKTSNNIFYKQIRKDGISVWK